jgi:hypothetical protein
VRKFIDFISDSLGNGNASLTDPVAKAATTAAALDSLRGR